MYAALAYLLADGDARNKRLAVVPGKPIRFDVVLMVSCVNSFWSGLQNKEFTGVSILSPFNIHWGWLAGQSRIVLLY